MKTETKILLALIALIAYAFFSVVDVFAAPANEYPNPYDLVCFDPLMSNVVLSLPGCGQSATAAKTVKGNDNETETVTVSNDQPQPETPVIVTETPATPEQPETPVVTDEPTQPTQDGGKDKDKNNCNKGEGNGGKGCDPGNNPDKGNDDENKPNK